MNYVLSYVACEQRSNVDAARRDGRRPVIVGLGALAACARLAGERDRDERRTARMHARFMASAARAVAGSRRSSSHDAAWFCTRASVATRSIPVLVLAAMHASDATGSCEPLVVVPLLVSAVLYAVGLARLWRRAGIGRGISVWSALSFAAGWMTLVVRAGVAARLGLARSCSPSHMTQHTLLMLVAAPLLTFGHPLLVWLWALPRRTARGGRAGAVRGDRDGRARGAR